jgi:hypothetical protein
MRLSIELKLIRLAATLHLESLALFRKSKFLYGKEAENGNFFHVW